MERELRAAIVAAGRRIEAAGLTQGTSGNIAARFGQGMLITPSGIGCGALAPEDIVFLPFEAVDGSAAGERKPSSEWRFHRDILNTRADCGAVVHTHSTFATALSMARKDIPPCHYMIATFGGGDVRCGDYATFGTAELSAAALRALDGRQACLLANHGAIALGATLEQAVWRAVELETIARHYVHALACGGPVLLTEEEVQAAIVQFSDYGPLTARRTA